MEGDCEDTLKEKAQAAGGKVCSFVTTGDGATVLVCFCATPKCNDLYGRRNINYHKSNICCLQYFACTKARPNTSLLCRLQIRVLPQRQDPKS